MSDPRFDLWKKHTQNTQAVDQAFVMVTRQAKDALRRGDRAGHATGSRLATLLLAALIECRINEVLWHYSGLIESEKISIAGLSVENRWRELVRSGFAKRRNLSSSAVPESLQFTDRARYVKLVSIIEDYVVPLLQVRNALAHGKWQFSFSKDHMSVDSRRTESLHRYSLWRVTLEKNLLDHLTSAVHDLVVTRSAHERDFDKQMRDLHSAEGRLKNGNRRKWERNIVDRYKRRPPHVSS